MNAWLPCTHIDYSRGVALVKSFRTQRSFPVTLAKDIRFLACLGDRLQVIKSPVTGEWMAIDYMRNVDTVGDFNGN